MAITDANNPMVPVGNGTVPQGSWQVYQVFKNELVNAAGEVNSVFKNPVDSPGLELAQFSTFGFYSVVTGATAAVEFKILQSYNNVAANFIVPDTDGSIVIVAAAGSHIDPVTPTPMPFIRFRATGQGGNGADTVVNAWVFLKTN